MTASSISEPEAQGWRIKWLVGCQNYIRIWMGHAASLWGLAGEDGELLAESQVLKDEMLAGAQFCAQGGAEERQIGDQCRASNV